ncbi:hypothetical protein ATO21_06010 [Pediococcus acidilactici]|uniref:hypothetical protein n=1 Tax=Pediococcus acidilactici TaxID=1254 RepID=UPI00071AF853|nr:hypothetical protein [Pediococcus acidilactici]KSV56211.1 hypothetical protein ATO21_06010 [Pediococcus acidilactici]
MDIRDLKKEIWKAYNERSVWTQKSDVDKFKKLLDELAEPKKSVYPTIRCGLDRRGEGTLW